LTAFLKGLKPLTLLVGILIHVLKDVAIAPTFRACVKNQTHPKSLSWEERDLLNPRSILPFSFKRRGRGMSYEDYHTGPSGRGYKYSHKKLTRASALSDKAVNLSKIYLQHRSG
jgi:hypothetical protein